MFKLIAPRDLAPIPAVAAAIFVAMAIFAWTERTVVVDPEGLSVSYWPWKLWQIFAVADGRWRGLVGLVKHPPRALGTQPGVGIAGADGIPQRLYRPVRGLQGRRVAHGQSVVHRLCQCGGGSVVALRMRCRTNGSNRYASPWEQSSSPTPTLSTTGSSGRYSTRCGC